MSNSIEDSLPAGLSRIGRWMSPLVLVTLLCCPAPDGLPISAWRLVAVTVTMAILWFTQGLPVAATSLLPICAYPLLGIQSTDTVSKSYIDSNIWLSLGGFIIALGIERWGLHRRLSLYVLYILGTSPRRLVLGFMMATCFASMWISNTAATLMMLPIGMALLKTLEEISSGEQSLDGRTGNGAALSMPWLPMLGTALVLGIGYAASIGGTMTPVGTPTNVAFLGIWKQQFPGAPEVPSGQWILTFAPFGVAMTIATWLVLTWYLPRRLPQNWLRADFFRDRLRALGRPSVGEVWMFTIFVSTALLWIFRTPFQIGDKPLVMGWGKWLEGVLVAAGWAGDFKASFLHDATVSIAMCLLMFCIPVEKDGQKRTVFLMDWETAHRLPWDLVLLFGGGFAMAGAFESTGLAHWIGDHLTSVVTVRSITLWVIIICTLMTFLTEFTSNVATVNMFLPIVASVSVSLGYDPRILMLPATIATSLGFMMPVGTPPNAIVFGTGRVRMDQMVKFGFVLNLIGIVLVSVFTLFWMVPVMGISMTNRPDWAQNSIQVKAKSEATNGEKRPAK